MTSIISSSGSSAAGRVSVSSLDTNGDGIISAEELEAAKSNRSQDPTVSSDNAATGAQSQLQSSMISMLLQSSATQTEGETPRDARDLFSAIDADGDGKITQDEFVAARPEDMSEEEATTRFGELDSEGAGFLTEETFAAGMPQPPQAIEADGTTTGTDDETVSIFDILAEMQRVIEAYRENGSEASEV
jgi:Ca2+-binding EF-hand superfamily protein